MDAADTSFLETLSIHSSQEKRLGRDIHSPIKPTPQLTVTPKTQVKAQPTPEPKPKSPQMLPDTLPISNQAANTPDFRHCVFIKNVPPSYKGNDALFQKHFEQATKTQVLDSSELHGRKRYLICTWLQVPTAEAVISLQHAKVTMRGRVHKKGRGWEEEDFLLEIKKFNPAECKNKYRPNADLSTDDDNKTQAQLQRQAKKHANMIKHLQQQQQKQQMLNMQQHHHIMSMEHQYQQNMLRMQQHQAQGWHPIQQQQSYWIQQQQLQPNHMQQYNINQYPMQQQQAYWIPNSGMMPQQQQLQTRPQPSGFSDAR